MSIAEPLPRARIADPQQLINSDEFVTFHDVPVFREHETTSTNSGETLRFDAKELQRVVDGCNRRITETGDYAVLTYGHTSDDPSVPSPDFAGFAGPFKLGEMALSDGKTTPCILADFHVPRSDLERFRKHPRRSPELWTGDNGDMHLDPIALLGGIPPRLDMGLLLYQRRTKAGVERYQAAPAVAAAPGASNVYIPGADDDQSEKEKEQYMLDQGSLKQVMDMFNNSDVVQKMKSLIAKIEGVNSTLDEPEEYAGEEPIETPEVDIDIDTPSPDAPPMLDETPAEEYEETPVPDTDMPAPGPDSTMPEADEPPDVDVDVIAGENPEHYEILDEMSDEDFEEYCRYRAKRTRYQDDPEVEVDIEPKPMPKPTEQYSRQQYSRIQRLESELKAERYQRVNRERYALLQEASCDRIFDVEAEFKRCAADKMSEAQFRDHYQAIRANYQRRPMNMPNLQPRITATEFNERERERYSKTEADRAFELCSQAVAEGKYMPYDMALQQIRNGNGKKPSTTKR